MVALLGQRAKSEKKSKVRKFNRHELNRVVYDTDYYWQEPIPSKLAYTIACVPVKRISRLAGKKHTYYILRQTDKDYEIRHVVNDLKRAEFYFNNVVAYDYLRDSGIWKEFQKGVQKQNGNGNKQVQNLEVKRNKKDRTNNDPILKIVYSMNSRPSDKDSDEVYAAKRNLATVRPKDYRVIVVPDFMPDFR